MLKYSNVLFIWILVYLSCAPKAILIEQPKLVSLYFEKKIKKLDRDNPKTLDEKRLLMKTKIEYGFGVIMEQADRLIDDDYMSAIKEYKRANRFFFDNLSPKYPK